MPHQFYPYHLAAFVIAALVVLATTPAIERLGHKVGCVDLPGERKVHKRPMVRMGGVAIFAGTLVALLLVWWTGGFGILPADKSDEVWGVTVCGLAFFLIGLADDLFSLSAFFRLFMQIIVACVAWQMGVQIEFLTIPAVGLVPLPDPVSLPITVLWLVGIANAINMIDGLDGLAAGVSGIAAVVMMITSLFMHQPAAALIAACLAGASIGFLRYNFNPAQIFMGDGGAYFMGFTLAGIGIIGLVKSVTTAAVLLPYLILAVPILDISAVVLDRLRRGKSPFTADKRHLHHRLLQAGLSQRLIVLFIYSLALWVGSLALMFSGVPQGVVYLVGATLFLTYTTWQVKKHARPRTSGE
ncbi:undecaprenyl-phosphate alpha-N-acetylglucosaminyl 1-phosphate transferase [Leptolyngbya sp. 'hensonii']|uniref:glycosyltransferase family 4 protein n=1 Tax=Leptolyngbya sp. 'hensonii' TaxID=1922337 RepID=UPI00094F72EC|nr:MraY family glycosyltransferase [Leptolyngbya sp. 'hensonii']OLP19801.1 undecaprenyl-phosphate alpha-N-acetylglucosaminyl 1-phosphate transferase [Leptolyngbya sp. 'hensonii']